VREENVQALPGKKETTIENEDEIPGRKWAGGREEAPVSRGSRVETGGDSTPCHLGKRIRKKAAAVGPLGYGKILTKSHYLRKVNCRDLNFHRANGNVVQKPVLFLLVIGRTHWGILGWRIRRSGWPKIGEKMIRFGGGLPYFLAVQWGLRFTSGGRFHRDTGL